jgi:hypothetical protein
MPANGRGSKNLFDPAANIRGVLGWGGLDVAMPIWRELHDSMNMHLAIERLVEDGDTVVALLNETGRFTSRLPFAIAFGRKLGALSKRTTQGSEALSVLLTRVPLQYQKG